MYLKDNYINIKYIFMYYGLVKNTYLCIFGAFSFVVDVCPRMFQITDTGLRAGSVRGAAMARYSQPNRFVRLVRVGGGLESIQYSKSCARRLVGTIGESLWVSKQCGK